MKTKNEPHIDELRSRWYSMKDRCLNANRPGFKYYGGRGISVCDEWMDFNSFYKWAMANGYKKELTLDRIENDGNYSPENCRWTTMRVQINNSRASRMITYNGETKSLSDWSRTLGFIEGAVRERLRKGWPLEMVFSKEDFRGKFQQHRKSLRTSLLTYNGRTMRLEEWASEIGIHYGSLIHRIQVGWPQELVFRKGNLKNKLRDITPMGESKYRGVSFRKPKFIRKGKIFEYRYIRASIMVNNRTKNLGTFLTEEEAARAYDKAAIEAYGEFAKLNFKENKTA